jgi:hypothetical protein
MHRVRGGTRGSETSQYPLEEKTTCDSVSSGERKRRRLNLGRVKPAGVAVGVLWGVVVLVLPSRRWHVRGVSGRFLERAAVVGESPVRENTACVMDFVPE